MLKAIMFATALATAGVGVVYAQATGGSSGQPTGTQRGQGAMAPERGQGMNGTMAGQGSQAMGERESTGGRAGATAQMMTTLPQHATAVSNWYDQNVYDQQDNKLGEIKDMLLDREGKVQAVIVSVGGFLGIGEKDVAVPFQAINPTQRDNKFWLAMSVNKDQLRSAPGFRYDRSKQSWTTAAR